MQGLVMGEWPIVGTGHLVDRFLELLDGESTSGVLLVGPAGIGKTAMARAVAAAAVGRGIEVRRVLANSATTVVPFGALSTLVTIDGDVDRARLRAGVEDIASRLPERLIVVVDDIASLDPGSTSLVVELVRDGLIRIVATARSTMPVAPEIDGLIVEGSVVRHQVQPLDRSQLAHAASACLGGALHPGALGTLWNASLGVPLHAREMLRANIAAGRFVERLNGWDFTEVPVVPPSLIDLVTSRFAQLTPDEQRSFESIALAQPLPLAAAVELAGTALLATLERSGLVVVTNEDLGPEVRLGHPLYDDVVRTRLGALQQREAVDRAARAMESLADQTNDLRFRAACLRVEHGLALDPERAVVAARRALALVDPALAERLVRHAGPGFDAQFTLGAALIAQGKVDEADACLLAASALADNDADRARVISRRGNNFGTAGGRFADSLAVLEEGMATISDPRWRSFIAADLAYARLWSGSVLDQRVDTPNLQIELIMPAAVRANECLVGAVVAVMSGELSLAERYVEEGLPLASALRDDVPTARDLLTLSRFLALAFAGDASGADQVVATELERASGRAEAAPGMWFAVRAMQALLGGRPGDAIRDAIDAERLLSVVDISGLHPLARAVRATALASTERVEESISVAESIEPTWQSEPKVRTQLAIAEAWRLVAAGDIGRASALLVSAGREALESNHIPFGAFAAYDAVRLGRPKAALPVLRSASARWEGPLGAAFVAHGEALARKRPDDLLTIAARLPALGFALAGAEAAAQASRLFDLAGDTSGARRAEYIAARLAQPLGDVRSPSLGTPRGLTIREAEIARRAASRQSSRDIGTALGISARTVDNHLAAVYQKLGITNRGGLAAHQEYSTVTDPRPPAGSARSL